jgi:hypothetical protein
MGASLETGRRELWYGMMMWLWRGRGGKGGNKRQGNEMRKI